jgi:sugar lactone lactonase YvrE
MRENKFNWMRRTALLASAALVVTVLTIFSVSAADGSWKEVRKIKLDDNEFTAVAVDSQDRIYAGAKSVKDERFSVAVYSADGKLLETIPVDAQVLSMTIAPDGVIFAATENQLSMISGSPGKRQAGKWQRLDKKAILTSLAVDDKHVFAADAGNRLVYVYGRDGKQLVIIKGNDNFIVPSPYFDVALDGNGGLWVADTGRHQLENYSWDGRFIAMWQPEKSNGFLGCCNPAHFQLISKGRIVTSEKGLVRVRVFGPDGKLESVVCGPEDFSPGSTHGHDIAADSKDRVIILDSENKELRIFAQEAKNGGIR